MLVALRWCAVAGQVATIAIVVWWLQVPLPLWPMGIAIAALALFNLQASYRIRRGGELNQRKSSCTWRWIPWCWPF